MATVDIEFEDGFPCSELPAQEAPLVESLALALGVPYEAILPKSSPDEERYFLGIEPDSSMSTQERGDPLTLAVLRVLASAPGSIRYGVPPLDAEVISAIHRLVGDVEWEYSVSTQDLGNDFIRFSLAVNHEGITSEQQRFSWNDATGSFEPVEEEDASGDEGRDLRAELRDVLAGMARDPELNGVLEELGIFEDPDELDYSEHEGDLFLDHLTSAQLLKLPEEFDGILFLNGLENAAGLILPRRMTGTLSLNGLSSAQGLVLPEFFEGSLNLDGLTHARGLVLPKIFRGTLSLDGLENAEGLVVPPNFEGSLFLSGLTSAENLTLPTHLKGNLALGGLTMAVGLKLPEHVAGLNLAGLTEPEGLVLPIRITEDAWLDGLSRFDGVQLPLLVGGHIWAMSSSRDALTALATAAKALSHCGHYDVVGKECRLTLPDGTLSEFTPVQKLRHRDPLFVLEAVLDPESPDGLVLELLDDWSIGNTDIDWDDSPLGETLLMAVLAREGRGAEACSRLWEDIGLVESGLRYLGILANPDCPESLPGSGSGPQETADQAWPESLLDLLREAGSLVGEPDFYVDPSSIDAVRDFARRYVAQCVNQALTER